MVLTKSELIASLQNEVRILLHLASKVDRSQLDYPVAAIAAQHDEYAALLAGASDADLLSTMNLWAGMDAPAAIATA